MASILASQGNYREALLVSEKALEFLRQEIAENDRKAHKVRESDILAFQESVRADLSAGQRAPDSTSQDD